jgi:hypothetical protein
MKPDWLIQLEEAEKRRMHRDEAVRQYLRARQAREEEEARLAEEAASQPRPEEVISTSNLVIKNGVAQSSQPTVLSNTALKTKQFERANISARNKK